MKKKIDLTNWREVVEYMVSQSKFEWKTEEYFIKYLQKDMIEEIYYLWDKDELNTNHWDNSVWDDELNREYKEYFNFKNVFYKNANVEKEDYFLTRYELKKKYGQNWFDKNHYLNLFGTKRNLSINQLELLTSLLKKGYYGFWSYEIDKDASIRPKFHQYNISELSEYINDKMIFENFEVEVNEQSSSKTQKLTM